MTVDLSLDPEVEVPKNRPTSTWFVDELADLYRTTPPPAEEAPGDWMLQEAMIKAFEHIRRVHNKLFHPNLIRRTAPLKADSGAIMAGFGNAAPAHFLLDTGMPFCTITHTQASILRNCSRVPQRHRQKWFQFYEAGEAPPSGPLALPQFKAFPTALIRLSFGKELGSANGRRHLMQRHRPQLPHQVATQTRQVRCCVVRMRQQATGQYAP